MLLSALNIGDFSIPIKLAIVIISLHDKCQEIGILVNHLLVNNILYIWKQRNFIYRHTSFYSALQILLFFFFNKLMVCGNPRLSKSIGAIFPIAFAHLVCLCYILVILSIFQTSSALLLYLFRWAIISDLWCYYSLKTQMVVSSLGQ